MPLYGTTPDATTSRKGKVQLAGDLGGTASAPTVLSVTGAAASSYTPTWTGSGSNPAIGNGTITGKYIQFGKFVWFTITVTMGSTTTFGTGNYSFSLPFTSNEASANFPPVGNWAGFDTSSGNNYVGFAAFASTTTVQLLTISEVTQSLAGAIVATTAPITWANGDKIQIKGTFERT